MALKYVAESRNYIFDFSKMPELVAGDTISSIQSVGFTPSGLTLGTPSINGGKVQVVISGGTSGTVYTINAIIQTSSNAILEEQDYLVVL